MRRVVQREHEGERMTYDMKTAWLASAIANASIAKRAMGLNLQLLSKENGRLLKKCDKVYDEIEAFCKELWAEFERYEDGEEGEDDD